MGLLYFVRGATGREAFFMAGSGFCHDELEYLSINKAINPCR